MPPQLYIAKSGAKNAPTLPLDAVTRTFGIFGQRGTGKTNTAVVVGEEMVRKGAHIVIFDPVGAWWGITHDGEGKGLPGIVLGGEHADVPLEETAGHLVADLVVGRHWPIVVVDMKLLRKGARQRFLADCLEELYFRNREPLHVFFEEADQALPQSPRGMDPTIGRVLGAAEDIVKLGRGRGLGATLVSQRFATVNKNVVEQVETLILLRLIGPNDRKAAKGWIESNGDPAVTQQVLDTLASLELGEAQLYSPGWLRLLERIRVRQRKTFDSSATPEVGQALAEPTKRAPVNLDELRERMAETVERAKANDPKELHKRIQALERQLEDATQAAPEPERVLVPDREAVKLLLEAAAELSAAEETLVSRFGSAIHEAREVRDDIAGRLASIGDLAGKIDGVLDRVSDLPREGAPSPARKASGSNGTGRAAAVPGHHPVRSAPSPSAGAGEKLRKAERAVLTVLAQFPDGRSKKQVAMLSGYSSNGGGFNNAMGALRSAGYITRGEPILATQEGLDALGEWEPLPTGVALLEHWLSSLGKAPAAVLRVVVDAWPNGLSKEEVGARAGYEPNGGGFNNALGKLRTLELISRGAEIVADETLASAVHAVR